MYETIMANENDIDELTKIRLAYIRDEQGAISGENESVMKEKLPLYFKDHLNKDLFAFVAKDGGTLIASAMLLVTEKPSNPHFINGRVGLVLNVYTAPMYRRKGISTALLTQMLRFAEKQDLDYIELNATQEGYPLYKKLGFKEQKTEYVPMRYDIHKKISEI